MVDDQVKVVAGYDGFREVDSPIKDEAIAVVEGLKVADQNGFQSY